MLTNNLSPERTQVLLVKPIDDQEKELVPQYQPPVRVHLLCRPFIIPCMSPEFLRGELPLWDSRAQLSHPEVRNLKYPSMGEVWIRARSFSPNLQRGGPSYLPGDEGPLFGLHTLEPRG